jgi:ferredoxin--NADP+ reductase
MKLLVEDLGAPKNNGDISDLLGVHRVVTQTHWELINSKEISLGEPLGKPRKKAADRDELLELGGLQATGGGRSRGLALIKLLVNNVKNCL